MAQGSQKYKVTINVDQPSINKHTPWEFDSNNESNQGLSPRGLELLKITIRMIDGKDPITWIFYMNKLFDKHQVPNLQNVVVAYLYLVPQ